MVKASAWTVVLGLCFAATPARAESPFPGLGILDAVRIALDKNPTLASGREAVSSAEGAATAAGAEFDTQLDAALGHARETTAPFVGAPAQETRVTTLRIGAIKRFRFGTALVPSIQLQRVDVSSGGQRVFGPQNTGRVVFEVDQPMLRGLGSAAHATEDAAGFLYSAAVAEFQHALMERVLFVARSYWAYAAAQRSLESATASEARFEGLLENIGALVTADQRGPGDLEQVEASLADRRRARVEADRAAQEARTELGLEMGLSGPEIDALSPPVTALPELVALSAAPEASAELARARRRDLRALESRLEAATHLVRAADDQLWPQLDLIGTIGWTGLNERGAFGDLVVAVGGEIPGVNVSVAVRFFWPVEQSGANGRLAQAVAAQRQAIIARDSGLREVEARAIVASRSLSRSIEAAALATKASIHHRKTVENERSKLEVGLSTLVDVITTESLLSAAESNEIRSQAELASSIATLRFATGTLASIEETRGYVDLDALLTPPGDL
ncbi:MAG: TolC family protein [Deltaproteobacteria bacterium]|nr:TolC family protein [Deltaproteobacteria bacterium]